MVLLECPAALQQDLCAQVSALHASQTAPFAGLVSDYAACLQRSRELEVRLGVLEREKAELTDEVDAARTQLAATDAASARDFATKAEGYRQQLTRANSEITTLLRDKATTLEQLLSLRREVDALRAAQEEAAQAAELASDEAAGLKERLAAISRALDEEKAARTLAAAEAEARVSAKVSAEAEAERLRQDNLALEASLRKMMEKEAEQLRKISDMHEEMMDNARRQQNESGAAAQLMGLLTRRRTSSTPATGIAAAAAAAAGLLAAGGGSHGSSHAATAPSSGAATPPSRRRSSSSTEVPVAGAGAAGAHQQQQRAGQQQPQHTSPHGALLWGSLKQKMGLPEGPVHASVRQLPHQPAKSVQAHPGGVCSLEFEHPGHQLATCGMDRTVQTWDLNLGAHVATFQGVMGSVNDVAYTSDARRLLGAGGDKRLLVWNAVTGQVVHTLTGHTNAVGCVCCSPLDEASAVSAGEDRCIKVWDLVRGYAARSVPCAKMPTALTLTVDGQTLITGHLDGTLCLWDLRTTRAGGQPMAEVRDHAAAVLCVRPTPHPDRLLTAAKDNSVRIWDFRQLATLQQLRAPHLTIGSIGSMARAKCHADMSGDGRFVAVGGSDGQVYVWDLTPQQAGQHGAPPPPSSAAAPSSAPGGAPVLRTLKHHKEAVVAAGWSSDCCQLVTADKAGVVAFWRLEEV